MRCFVQEVCKIIIDLLIIDDMCKAIFQDCWRSLLSHNAVVKVKILQVILLCLFAMISIARVEAANNAKAIQISTNVE